jgi:hypothetical protein
VQAEARRMSSRARLRRITLSKSKKISMKNNTIQFFFLAAIITLVFVSCKTDKKGQLVGTWKMAGMKIQYYDQQKEASKKQTISLQDSISKTTDTAKLNKFQRQLMMVQKRADEFKANQDSAMKNNRWEFKSNGDFSAAETDGKKDGIWSLDEDKMLLFTIINKQTASVHVKFDKDTLTLQLDSLNYMKFARVK